MSQPPINDLPTLSIRRPLLVLVLNLLLALAGAAAILGVEVRELPDVDRPVVTVRGDFPGASPETMDAEVTSIVERAVARVSGVKAIRSSSEENNFRMHVEFTPEVDLDSAAADVREAVSRIERRLPEAVEQLTVIKADADARPIMTLAVMSDRLPEEELARVVEQDIVPALIAIEGVADVPLFGARKRMLRVVVDPLRLASYGLAISDVAAALRSAPFDVPAGSFRSDDQELLVRADASVVEAAQVEAIVIRGTTRVGDVAHVFFGPEDARAYVRLDGRPVIGLGIVRQARSNTIEIASGVERAVERLNQRFDDTLELRITANDAIFIRSSVQEVLVSLGLAVLIVIATLWLFMGSLRTTLVPSVAIPVALIGTVAAIWLFGFSINILTLLALVLATGLVVDDAIVVLENIQRRRSQGLGKRAAAVLGTRQVFFAVVVTSAVLISVFVPIAFLPGTAGRLFREFGFVLAVAVAISSFVALSLIPSLAVRIAREPAGSQGLRHLTASVGRGLTRGYDAGLRAALNYPLAALLIAFVAAGGALALYPALDQELLPEEDRGLFYVRATGPDGVGLHYMERQAEAMEAILRPLVASGEADSLYTIVGRWDPNRIWSSVPLAAWETRERTQQAIMDQVRGPLAAIPGARVSVSSPNSLDLRGAGNNVQLALLGEDYGELYEVAQRFAAAIEQRLPNLTDPELSYQPTQPQLSVQIDRRRAADLGIPLEGLAATLRAMIDGDEVVDLNVADQAVPILLESITGAIKDPTDLVNLYVATESGRLLPLSSVVSLKEEGVAAELDRHEQRRAIEIDASRGPGYPIATAVAELEALAVEVLPPGIGMVFLGEAATLEETSRDVTITYAVAILVVFLVLAAQFESITSALVVVLTVPFGVAAAVYALWLTGTSINIYSQIGLVMLIGLMAKNGILLVEFADQLRDRGQTVREAVRNAAHVRLRPIAMTLISTVLGGLPLILSGGAGGEARAAIGWVVFGGLGLAAVFTLFLTPVFYLGIARFSKPRAAEAAKLGHELAAAGEVDRY